VKSTIQKTSGRSKQNLTLILHEPIVIVIARVLGNYDFYCPPGSIVKAKYVVYGALIKYFRVLVNTISVWVYSNTPYRVYLNTQCSCGVTMSMYEGLQRKCIVHLEA